MEDGLCSMATTEVEMTTFEDIQIMRAGTKVKRFHTLDLIVPETVGHHSCNVALMLTVLTNEVSGELLAAALYHDLAEQYTGDVPATAKWESPRLARALKRLEQYHFPAPHTLSKYETKLLKQADMLDLCFKVLEEVQMGNLPMGAVLERGLTWLRENEPTKVVIELIKEIEHEYYSSK